VTCEAEIWGAKLKTIIDTGSSGCIISKKCLDQLERIIEGSSNISLVGINGQKHRPLGIVRNVPVTLGNKQLVEITMQVTEATNYELILGVDWLRKINGIISIGEKVLITTKDGITAKHPIQVERLPKIISQPGDDEYEEEDMQEEVAFLNEIITDHKQEQMARIFTTLEWEDLEEEHKPITNPELTIQQQNQLDKFLHNYEDLFANGLYELGHTQDEVHSIPTNCPFPQNQKAYHHPPHYNEFIKEEIQQMLDTGIIRESTSSWASPIVVVKKKNGNLRFCIDYRKLNSYTEQDKYPLPLISDIFDSLEGARWFSSLDLASGYWQMEVAEEDKKKTAFISKHGLYEFNRMPFGLTNAPASFQRLMNKVLSKEIGRFVVVYLDDINIYSKSFEEHLEHLEIVFKRLRQAGLKLGKDKCSFVKTQLEFLGHIVGRDGLQPDPKKVEKVRDWPTPKTIKDVRSFLGLASYYRRFMKDFSKIAKPMYQLTKQDEKFEWGSEQEKAFNKLKQLLIQAPVVAYPDFTKPFILYTDGSHTGLGAILEQKDEEGRGRVIAYASRTIRGAEERYSATELEFLALHWACTKEFRLYLLGKPFTHITDHQPLRNLKNTNGGSRRIQNWRVNLEEFTYKVEYKPGKTHRNVDTLSRRPESL
jgi:hypothetical protein